MPCALCAPGDQFEKCTKSCTNDTNEVTRINSWQLKDATADKCSIKCCCVAYQLMDSNGNLKVEELAQKVPGLDVTMFGERKVDSQGFMGSFVPFVNKNRAALVKVFDHQEGAA